MTYITGLFKILMFVGAEGGQRWIASLRGGVLGKELVVCSVIDGSF
jgi:hypothetical protein